MSPPELSLLLGDEVAGTVKRLAGGKLSFAYNPTYVANDPPTTPVSGQPRQQPLGTTGG